MFIEIKSRKKGKVYKVHVKKNGKTITKTFPRKHDARKWGQDMETVLESRGRLNLTFKELANEWLTNHSKIKNAPSSYKTNISQLSRINTVIGDKVIHSINYGDIEMLVTHLLKQRTKKNVSVNRYLALVRTIFNYAVRRGDLFKNPVNKEHFLSECEVPYKYWQKDEAERFLAFAEQKYKDKNRHVLLIYKIALNTGMRLGEILALKWDAVYLHGDTPSITVKRSYCTSSRQIRETTKGSRVRYIGINHVLKEALKETYKERSKENDLVVSNNANSIIERKNLTSRNFLVDIKESGVTPISFKDTRHTFASIYMMNGGNIYDLQKILGHRDVQTTMRYAHLAKDYILNKSSIVVIGQKDNVVSVNFKESRRSVS